MLLVVMLRWFEHSQVYHPGRAMDASGADLRRPFEDVWFKAQDGVTLNAWFFPAQTNTAPDCLAVILCHGNAGNISHRLATCQALLESGVSVLSFDYRGYGRSHGSPSEEGTYHDAQAAYLWLRQKGFAARNIIPYGESLGGGVAAELALREEVGGLVLQSTFTSVTDLGAELFPFLPVRWLSQIHYDTCAKLPRLKNPVLIMHSRGDSLVPFKHSERNFAAAQDPKLFCVIGGDHNNPLEDREAFQSGIEKFLAICRSK